MLWLFLTSDLAKRTGEALQGTGRIAYALWEEKGTCMHACLNLEFFLAVYSRFGCVYVLCVCVCMCVCVCVCVYVCVCVCAVEHQLKEPIIMVMPGTVLDWIKKKKASL